MQNTINEDKIEGMALCVQQHYNLGSTWEEACENARKLACDTHDTAQIEQGIARAKTRCNP